MNPTGTQSVLDENTFRAAGRERRGNDAFAESRECSWADFKVLPMPNRRMEEWRFASLSQLNFGDFSLPGKVSAETAAALVARSRTVPDAAGTLVFADDTLIAATLDPALAARGVVFAPMRELSPEARRVAKPYFFVSGGGICSEKISALHRAYTDGGAYLLHVPAGLKIEKPFVVHHWNSAAGTATFPYALVLAEENSSVVFLNFFRSENEAPAKASRENAARALTISRLEIFAKAGATVSRKFVQETSADTDFYQQEWTHVHENASVRGITLNLGARRSRTTTELRLEGKNARADLFSLSVADGEQETDQRTMQRHISSDATSNLLFKNVLLDRSRTIFGGSIVVAPAAPRTNAVQSNRNLILSPDAESHSLPGLEIETDDVSCSHGATNGTLDADQLFYLLQRGVPEAEARALLVRGFFEEVLGKVESPAVAETLREAVLRKIRN